MIEKRLITEHLSKTVCHKCGTSLEGAELIPISKVPVALIAHVICPRCQAESMVTITLTGSETVPLISDLTAPEIKKFLGTKSITQDEVLDLHQTLKKKSLWKLLHKKEHKLVKKQKR